MSLEGPIWYYQGSIADAGQSFIQQRPDEYAEKFFHTLCEEIPGILTNKKDASLFGCFRVLIEKSGVVIRRIELRPAIANKVVYCITDQFIEAMKQYFEQISNQYTELVLQHPDNLTVCYIRIANILTVLLQYLYGQNLMFLTDQAKKLNEGERGLQLVIEDALAQQVSIVQRILDADTRKIKFAPLVETHILSDHQSSSCCIIS